MTATSTTVPDTREAHAARVRIRREILSLDMDEAERLIAIGWPTYDPIEIYWDFRERAEMRAEAVEGMYE